MPSRLDRSPDGRLASTLFWLLVAGVAAAPFIALSTTLYALAFFAFLLLRPRLPATPALAFMILFAGVSVASLFAAAQPGRALDHLGEIGNLVVYPMFLAGLALGPVRRVLPWIVLGQTAVLALWGLIEFAFKVPGNPAWRIRGPMSHYMTYSGLLVLLFGMLAAYAVLGEDRRLRLWSAIAAVLAVVPMILNLTRNAWMGVLAAVVLLALARRKAWIPAVAAAAVTLLILVPNPAGKRFLSIFDPQDATNRDRVAMWSAGWAMALEQPATGQGLGTVKDNYLRFKRQGAVRAWVQHLHSNPVHILAERGFVALAAYLGFVGAVLWTGWKRRNDWLGLASLLACGGIFAAGLFEYNFGDTEVLWLTLAAAALEVAMATVYKVSQLLELVKGTLEDDFGAVAVEGEASGVKAYPSGHVYFSLKDDRAVLSCVLWSSIASRLPFKLEDGRTFLCAGKLTLYPQRGQFQMEVRKVEPAGLGGLKLALDQLRKKLAAEGLFDTDRKKPLTDLPLRIGVVTSPEGAALQDFLKVLHGSPLNYEVRVFPAQVQGKTAAAEVRAALAYFQKRRPDLIVITRGGGSFEDLMPFNDEGLVRAVAGSAVPVISAVGHEVDTTLCDEAADLRCPTPTAAAAEIAGRHAAAVQRFDDARERLEEGMAERLDRLQTTLGGFRQRFSPRGMEAFLVQMGDRLKAYAARLRSGALDQVREQSRTLERLRMTLFQRAVLLTPGLEARVQAVRTAFTAFPNRLDRKTDRLAYLKKGLTHLSVRETLKRGYAVLTKADRTAVLSQAEVAVDETLEAMLYDGGLTCQVREKKKS